MNSKITPQPVDESKRSFIKQASYVTPAIVTLSAIPSFASAGSGYSRGPKRGGRPGRGRGPKGNEGLGNGYDGPPPGHRGTNYNDYEGTSPGNPGRRHPRGK